MYWYWFVWNILRDFYHYMVFMDFIYRAILIASRHTKACSKDGNNFWAWFVSWKCCLQLSSMENPSETSLLIFCGAIDLDDMWFWQNDTICRTFCDIIILLRDRVISKNTCAAYQKNHVMWLYWTFYFGIIWSIILGYFTNSQWSYLPRLCGLLMQQEQTYGEKWQQFAVTRLNFRRSSEAIIFE